MSLVLGPDYRPMRSHTLQATHIILFVHKAIESLLSDVKSAAVACGLGGTMGNKGGVAISFKIGATRCLFINSHLAAHQHAVNERNIQIIKILRELVMSLASTEMDALNTSIDGEPQLPDDSTFVHKIFERIVFMGDMNYRIRGNR